MESQEDSRSEGFLKLYRVLEGQLEKRMAGKKQYAGSVVMAYLKEPDSLPIRADLDICREIRNLLSHNADADGEPLIEPSEGTIRRLREIVDYVQRPRLALDHGTPGDRILFAHPNDSALDTMRHMMRLGYSHVPVRDRTGLVGVLSAGALMSYVCQAGLNDLRDDLRVGDLKGALHITDGRSDRYMFFDKDATLTEVREAFDSRRERNHRLAVAFITEDGGQRSPVLAMLTPWDLLRDPQ